MTSSTRCRAQDPPNCKDPNCPEKRAHAARLAAFMNHPAQARVAVPRADSVAAMKKLNLKDIAPLKLFEREIAARYINTQVHPTLPYKVLDYSPSTQYEGHWNAATLAARGLLINYETNEVIGRPFTKFFNWGEREVRELDPALLEGPISVTDKADGSLATSYLTPEGLAIATRGSFTSEQALHATDLLRERWAGKWEPVDGRTYMFEIIYPTNRIVVDYGAKDDLVLLAAIDISTGRSIPASQVAEWPGEKIEEFDFDSIEDVLAAEPRLGVEGYVVHFLNSDVRIKIKQDDYVVLHRIMTGVNSRRVWEELVEGRDVERFLINVPEEFADFVRSTASQIQGDFDAKLDALQNLIKRAEAATAGMSQKEKAAYVFANFKKVDAHRILGSSRGISPKTIKGIWLEVQPPFERSFFAGQMANRYEVETDE